MDFRRAVRGDLPQLLHLCRFFRTSPFSFDPDFLSLSPTKTIQPVFARDMLQADHSITIIMEFDKEIAGFITISTNPLISGAAKKKIGSILLLVLDEKYREQGLSRLLIQKGLALLQNMEVFLVTVGTDLYNVPAIRAYESQDFRFAMSWHIFRYFPGQPLSADPDQLVAASAATVRQFIPFFRRPISLLREKSLKTEALKSYLSDLLVQSIERGTAHALGYRINENAEGLIIYRQDEMSRNSLQTEQNIIRISDVLFPPENASGLESRLMSGLISKLNGSSVLEIWIEAENSRLIKAAEETGFRLSYSGVSLHRQIKL